MTPLLRPLHFLCSLRSHKVALLGDCDWIYRLFFWHENWLIWEICELCIPVSYLSVVVDCSSVKFSQCLSVATVSSSNHHFDRTSASRFAFESLSPISFRGSSSDSSPPSPQPPPRWPARWWWWRAQWPFPQCTAGCPPTPATPRLAAEGCGTLHCRSRRRGGGAQTESC